jgi:hypothetical protein
MERVQPIEGFKVMDWIRDIREKGYQLYKEDPEEYIRQIKRSGKSLRKRIKRINKASKI